MESFLAAIAGHRGDDAAAKAQDVMYEAWERTTSRSRIALARKALGISPLCADAYVLLAEEAGSIEEARDYYAKGVPRDPYPPYVRFAPGAVSPTTGVEALSGSPLPGGYAGLIIQLNLDSVRRWSGGPGTANISVPVPMVRTLRFGIFQGKGPRPRAEYGLDMRYLYPGTALRAQSGNTNVMVYGYAGDTGHRDIRMLVPARPAREIQALLEQHGRALPANDDISFLEWSTVLHPSFRLTLLERNSQLFQQAMAMLAAASAANGCSAPPKLIERDEWLTAPVVKRLVVEPKERAKFEPSGMQNRYLLRERLC